MPSNKILKLMINERLSEAADGIFALFEQSIAEYQREIVRLKSASEAKPEVALLRTRTAGHIHEENTISFLCKEETEQLTITEAHMQITNVQTIDNGEESQPYGQQQRVKREGPEASGGAETHNSFEPTSEFEEKDSDADSEEFSFGSDAPKKPFSCSVCRKRFSQKRGLKMHVKKAHTSEKPLSSAECMAQLDSEQHSQPDVESKDRPFSCTVCKRQFKLKFTLEAHMRSHAGGDPFYCSVCVASFPNHIDFTGHIKTAPYSCPVCGRGFLQKGNLKYHMFTHTGEKPFSCSECGARYTSKQNLMKPEIVSLVHHNCCVNINKIMQF
uniref:C2H2-type domain-containing protein n=1 Tax=Neogobius melanostomus TaxID=47308 RepID=A0A8C6SEA3_9GOBI